MASWGGLPDTIIVKVYEYIPEEWGDGRLVCKSWHEAITAEASLSKDILDLHDHSVSLVRAHELFPNLTKLRVKFPNNTDAFALFLWTRLETLCIVTKWRQIFCRDYRPTTLVITESSECPDLLQLYFYNESPNGVEDWPVTWPTEHEVDMWYKGPEQEPGNEGWNNHQQLRGTVFGLKGVGRRVPGSIVAAAFGVYSKTHDWDLLNELFSTSPSNIHERLPFFRTCDIVCLLFSDLHSGHHTLYTNKVLQDLFGKQNSEKLDRTLPANAVIVVAGIPGEETVTTYCGRLLWCIREGGVLTFSVDLPALLPEHLGYESIKNRLRIVRELADLPT